MIDADGTEARNEPTNENQSGSQAKAQAQNEDAQQQLEALKAELKEQQNKYLYLYAEFETYKKRAIRERSDLIKFGHESFARELLQVADNLDRALEHTNNIEGLVSGIRMVKSQLGSTLKKFGVEEVPALGEKFDPLHHEAVGQEKVSGSGNGNEEGTVIKEHQKGYTLHGRLLRPSRVVVATK